MSRLAAILLIVLCICVPECTAYPHGWSPACLLDARTFCPQQLLNAQGKLFLEGESAVYPRIQLFLNQTTNEVAPWLSLETIIKPASTASSSAFSYYEGGDSVQDLIQYIMCTRVWFCRSENVTASWEPQLYAISAANLRRTSSGWVSASSVSLQAPSPATRSAPGFPLFCVLLFSSVVIAVYAVL